MTDEPLGTKRNFSLHDKSWISENLEGGTSIPPKSVYDKAPVCRALQVSVLTLFSSTQAQRVFLIKTESKNYFFSLTKPN